MFNSDMGWKFLQSSAALPGFGTEITVCSYCGDCLVGHTGCVEISKLCNTFGAALLQNICGGILSGLLSSTALDRFNCRGKFIELEGHG